MDFSSTSTLFRVFEEIIEWRSNQGNLIAKIPWTESHLANVYSYILKLSSINSDLKLLNFAKKLPFSGEMVESFMQELQEFFIVPMPKQLYDEGSTDALKKSPLLAAFISFLLQLLHDEPDLVHSFGDRINDLKKELRFLVTILGDTLLLGDELEQVSSLLADFERVANEAGSLVYSFIFSMDDVYLATRMGDDLDAVFNHIYLLKANIIEFSNLVDDHTTQKTVAVHSLFIVDSLLHDLEDLINRNDDRIVDVRDQIRLLHQELTLSKSLLDDIKLPRRTEIEETMTQIRDVGYEAEYLINSFLVGDAPLWYLTVRLPKIFHKIKHIGTQMQEIKKNYDNIGVLKVAKDLNAQLSFQAQRYFEVDDITVGLEDKATHVLEQLEGGTEHLQFITIFGMPGLGKTTLAKKLFNHPLVSSYFDRRSWCVISQTYQRKNLLIGILNGLQSEQDKIEVLDMDEESLGENIYKCLKGRRYLIVMDDIWDSNAWDAFRRYFPDDENGSRILFTSRNKDAVPPNSIIYGLPSLSNDECWELLQKKVFHDEPCPPQLQWIGKEIAESCQGLPLAVAVVAGILSNMDKEESAWKSVGGSLVSRIFSEQNNSIMQILKLSYKHLPEHLKPCFLYFGAFPEDAEIPVKKLKCLWIAEGFIHKDEMLNTAESVAEEYLIELLNRSLIIVAERRSDGGAKACVLHDLLRDLCLRIAEEENFFRLTKENYSLYTRHHRLYVPDTIFLPYGFHIRSLFVSDQDSSRMVFYSPPLNFLNLKLLRLLNSPSCDLSDCYGSEHLVHLRYLVIECMPASIGNLVNLEFLIVISTKSSDPTSILTKLGLVSISSLIQKLVKLKYLSVPKAYFDKNCNSHQTNNLEFLSDVVIDKVEDEEMLKWSPHLRKLKCKFAKSLDEHDEYRYPDLRFLSQLESLRMSNLRIGSRKEVNFPSNIKKLTLYDSRLLCEKMSIIGRLPKLEILKLGWTNLVGGKWDTRDGEFQQLRFLELNDVKITQWNVTSSEHFPKLQRLVLRKCYDLQEISCEIGEIVTLLSIEVEFCPKSVAESALQIQQEQRDMGNEELRVIISYTLP